MRRPTIVLAFTGLLTVSPLGAQGAPPPCHDPHYREFDFWLGEWEVRNPAGQLVARSTISSILAGCVVKESYALLGGPYRGESYNTWDQRTKRWHQSWVDNGGLLALFDGGRQGDAMVLEGDGADASGPFRSRMTFTPLTDGRVRQLWERSPDRGATWTTMFDGYYTRAAPR